MIILAFTDIHGAYDMVAEILARESNFDAIVLGGDVTTNGTPGEAEAAVRKMQTYGSPVLVVAGNMDSPELDRHFSGLGVSINATGRLLGDVGFFGVSAAPFSPLNTPYEISEPEIRRRADAGWEIVRNAAWKIFVPHAPPYQTAVDRIYGGRHVGSRAVKEFIERIQPDVTICGHIHESRGLDTIGKTKIINCGPAHRGYYAVITVGDGITVELRG